MTNIGVVVIGRNEGRRLERCLASVTAERMPVVYVDSGSSDGSAAVAREAGADVVELNESLPFTAARARNEGFAHLLERHGEVQLVQFVDGDCELVRGWLGRAAAALDAQADVAAVCGRLYERQPDSSVYSRLCEMEWRVAPGEVRHCGGIFMVRVDAFREVGGFRAETIAGEEPELCAHLRGRGWRLLRLAEDMGWHDAAMLRFRQWWRRKVRCGHAFAHGALAGWAEVRQAASALAWGAAAPAVGAVSLVAGAWMPWALVAAPLAAVGYARLLWCISRRRVAMGEKRADALLYASFCILGKVPEALGIARFAAGLLSGGRSGLIEYKRQAEAAVESRAPAQAHGSTAARQEKRR